MTQMLGPKGHVIARTDHSRKIMGEFSTVSSCTSLPLWHPSCPSIDDWSSRQLLTGWLGAIDS